MTSTIRFAAHFLVVASAVLPPLATAALPSPLDETQLRQQEQNKARQAQQQITPDVRLTREADSVLARLPATETPCFPIHALHLQGERALAFEWALDAANSQGDTAIGRCLGANGINLVMKRIQNAIIARGYVTTRVLAEPQDLKTGNLTLTLIPGKIRSIALAPDTDPRATLWNVMPARAGDLLNLRDIEQGLENLKRVPTADADIQIVPGEQPGESDLIVHWKQTSPFRLNLSIDDSGSKATGKYQGGLTFSYDHMFTLNDLFYLSLNHDLNDGSDRNERGTHGYTAHYSVPYGNWLIGFNVSDSSYHQSVAGINQTYPYSGESQNSDIKLTRLLYRDAVRKTHLALRGWTRASRNFIDDTEIEIQRRRTAGWEMSLAHREFIGQATLDGNLAYRRGTGAMDAMRAPEEATASGTSRLELISADLQLAVPFKLADQSLRYTGVWRGQWNRTPLVPQDRFAIGGRYTVRGFDGESLLSADRGWLIRNDLALALGASGQSLYLGVDYGEVGGPNAALLAGTRLAGAVVGVRGTYKALSYDVFVGTPLKKPEGFNTADTTAGFSLSWTF